MASCTTVVNELKSALSAQFAESSIDGSCFLVTPFLLPDNTPIALEVVQGESGNLIISDYGQAADYAFVHGVGDRVVASRLDFVKRRFNADVDGGVISKTASGSDAANAAISVITGVQDVGYLIYKRSSKRTKEMFNYEVEAFLATRNRSFSKNVVLPGKTGERSFDYVVRGDHKQLALSLFETGALRGGETKAKVLSFNYTDVKERLEGQLDFAVILDTRSGRQPSKEVMAILDQYIPRVVRWEDRHQINEMLAA